MKLSKTGKSEAAASIEQTLNAEVAQAKFFGVDADEIEQKKQVYETVLEALRTTRVELEAAAFVMVGGYKTVDRRCSY